MPYAAPLDDVRFVLERVLHYPDRIATLPGYEEADLDTVLAVFDEAASFCEGVLYPLNRTGDQEGCTLVDGEVRTPTGFRDAYRQWCRAGWQGIAMPTEFGGAGLPHAVENVLGELLNSSNISLTMYATLSHGAAAALLLHGSDDQRRRYLPHLASGDWSGTMCLTEAHAGTDLGMIRTRAVPDGDGYRVTGQKIFITAGEHDLTDNIVHLVLAKLPDAPPGTRGISMFIVPKVLPDGSRNGVECLSIEHKMGIRGSATCVLGFENAVAELVGEPHRGMRYMFTMMNGARLHVGIQGLALAEVAYQQAAAYARERLQGRALAGPARPDLDADPIIVHPDVRRTLLRIRSQVEAGRALALWTATELDIEHHHPDPERRREAADRVALLTPIVKAGLTDLGFEAASAALGVFGGSGYISETGVEQHVRDARITQIYEGTNAIQALDLVGRKLPEGAGRLMRRFFHPATEFVATRADVPELADFVGPLGDALGRLQRTVLWLGERMLADREEAGAAATDMLRLFHLVIGGYLWALMAEAALGDGVPEARRETKLAVGRFYMQRVLPETAALAREITAGKRTLMALPAESF
jgi:alkylation response protein AidB-like acyl-CoA dehydrogenase